MSNLVFSISQKDYEHLFELGGWDLWVFWWLVGKLLVDGPGGSFGWSGDYSYFVS